MKYVTWKEIETEIELQRLDREKTKLPKKKAVKKVAIPKKKKEPKVLVEKRKYVHKKEFNDIQEAILKALRAIGDMTRKEILIKIEHPRTTVLDNLTKLARKNLIRKTPHPLGKRGRPTISWSADMG